MPSQAVLELLVEMKDQASKGLFSVTDALGTLGTVAGGVALAGVAALGAAVVSGVGDAREAAKIYAQTEAVIKSTGGVAGVTAAQVTDLATALSAASGKSLFGDAQIQSAENILLTFTNIGKDIFPRATQATLDMAAAFKTTPEAFDDMIGKALNSEDGFIALKRAGVALTDSQAEQIKTLFAAGDAAAAQTIILDELAKEYGGAAAAAADADGGWAQFNDRMGEAAETVGAAILPILTQLGGFLLDTIVPAIETAAAAFAAWLADPAVQAGIQQIGDAITTGLGVAFDFIANTAIPALLDAWALIQPAVDAILPLFSGEMPAALGQTGETFTLLGETVSAIMALIQGVISQVLPAIAAFWRDHGAQIQTIVKAAFDYIMSVVNVALELIKGVINVALKVIQGDWSGAWEALKTMSANVVLQIGDAIKSFLNLLASLFNTNLDAIVGTFNAFASDMVASGAAVVQNIRRGIESAWGSLVGWFNNKLQELRDMLPFSEPKDSTSPLYGLSKAGRAIVDMISRGVASAPPISIAPIADPLVAGLGDALPADLTAAMQASLNRGDATLQTAFAGIVDQASAARVRITDAFSKGNIGDAMKELGRDVLDGFADGMLDGLDNVLDIIDSTADTVEDAFRDAFDAHSPAERTVPIGEAVIGGVGKGMLESLPALVGQLQQIGSELLRGLETSVNAGSKKVQEKIKTLLDTMQQMTKLAEGIGGQISKAVAAGFEAEGSIDRLIAQNLDAVQQFSGGRLSNQSAVQGQLDEALRQAAGFADPQEAAAFYEMRSKQIIELGALQEKINNDISDAQRQRLIAQQAALEEQLKDAEGAQADSLNDQIARIQDALENDLSATQRSIIDRQLALITAAQEAERKAFQITADASASPQQQIADQIQAIIAQLSRVSLNDAGIALVDQLAGLAQLISGSRGFNAPTPIAVAGGPIDSRGQPVTINNTFNLPAGSTRDTVNAVIAQLSQQVAGRR